MVFNLIPLMAVSAHARPKAALTSQGSSRNNPFALSKVPMNPISPLSGKKGITLCLIARAAGGGPRPRDSLSRHVGPEQVVGVAHAVDVGALVVVGGVDTRADESVADVKAGTQGSLDV